MTDMGRYTDIYAEVRTDYNADGFTCIDAWRTDDDNEEGRTVAVVHESGDVYYNEPEARRSQMVTEAVAQVRARAQTLNEQRMLEQHMTDYWHDDRIAEIDDICCLMDQDGDEDKLARLAEEYKGCDPKAEHDRLMRECLEEAFRNYLDKYYQVPK